MPASIREILRNTANSICPASTLAVAALCMSCVIAAGAQILEPPTSPIDSARDRTTSHVSILPSESLGSDDLIEIMVSHCPELSQTFRVSSDGSLSLPLLHQRLMVAGLTPTQLAEALRFSLQQEGVLVDPVVNISVLEFRSRPVVVVGAVNHPLTFQATGPTTLLDALAKAGGLGTNASGQIIVTSKQAEAGAIPRTLPQVISVKDLIGGGNPGLNLQLHGGEEIRAPEANNVFVAGNVRRPGMYPMQADGETTVVKAITLSLGLDAYSSGTAFIYRRRSSDGGRNEIRVELNRIMTHKVPDVALMADDILYIPGSDGKRITSRVLSQLAGFGQAAGAGVLIYK